MNFLLAGCIGLLIVNAVLYGALGLFGMTAVWLIAAAVVAWLRDINLGFR